MMLRAISKLCIERPALEVIASARREAFKGFRTHAAAAAFQTVLTKEKGAAPPAAPAGACAAPLAPAATPPPPPPPPPPSPPGQQGRHIAAAAVALTASLGGVYIYRKLNDEDKKKLVIDNDSPAAAGGGGAAGGGAAAAGGGGGAAAPLPLPAAASSFPAHVQFLIAGGGTAAFAALRALRAAQPTAQVLVVSAERELPYMRPPLSKELWRERDLSPEPDKLTFRQWNGKRRTLTYEPEAFYVPVEQLAGRAGGGVAVARGWRVVRVAPERHEATLQPAAGGDTHTLTYDKCLVATGASPRRLPALARLPGARVLRLRSASDARALAAALDAPRVRRVAVLGGGVRAAELTAALADRLSGTEAEVVQIFREPAAAWRVLPRYLAEDATRRLREAGAQLLPMTAVLDARMAEGRAVLELSDGGELPVDLVVDMAGGECAGEVGGSLAAASRLESDARRGGGLVVNAELEARRDLFAAGDVASYYSLPHGERRRVPWHDHAVASGRRAGENMAAAPGAPLKPYEHTPMMWSDLGPHLGYEAIGVVDSRLATVGVFAHECVTAGAAAEGAVEGTAVGAAEGPAGEATEDGSGAARRYERGVVFYTEGRRVVGVLLWNLFNRVHTARQVLAVGEFDDLFEVAKLFSPQLEE